MESDYDKWRTATPYDYEIADDELEDDNLSVDTSFIEEEDEEIKSLISSESNKGGENMVNMIPIIIDDREYILRVVRDENGKIIKGELCLPLKGGLAMVLKGDE